MDDAANPEMPAQNVEIVAATDGVSGRIHNVRGQNVILDSDLATLYGVQTGDINQAVKRNRSRFPEDFVFALVVVLI